MPRKKKDYRETLATYQVHMKDGREKFLNDVASWYNKLYPARADFFKRMLRQLREVSTSGYQAGETGEMQCTIRAPTELVLFIQQWIPDFGLDSADLELLAKVWCDLLPATNKHCRRTRLHVRNWNEQIDPPSSCSETETGSEEEDEKGPPTCEHGLKIWVACPNCARKSADTRSAGVSDTDS
jgi:hypothetical protein